MLFINFFWALLTQLLAHCILSEIRPPTPTQVSLKLKKGFLLPSTFLFINTPIVSLINGLFCGHRHQQFRLPASLPGISCRTTMIDRVIVCVVSYNLLLSVWMQHGFIMLDTVIGIQKVEAVAYLRP